MPAETKRIITVTGPASRKHYPMALFSAGEAFRGACTSKSAIYCASIAVWMMIGQFTKHLRAMPVDTDVTLNLLAGELAAK